VDAVLGNRMLSGSAQSLLSGSAQSGIREVASILIRTPHPMSAGAHTLGAVPDRPPHPEVQRSRNFGASTGAASHQTSPFARVPLRATRSSVARADSPTRAGHSRTRVLTELPGGLSSGRTRAGIGRSARWRGSTSGTSSMLGTSQYLCRFCPIPARLEYWVEIVCLEPQVP
jgi:hypothetical protein